MNRIKELRKEKRITQLQLADALGIPRSNITRYENGSRKLNGALVLWGFHAEHGGVSRTDKLELR